MAHKRAQTLILPAGLLAVARIIAACLIYFAVLSAGQIVAIGLSLTLIPEPARGTFDLVGLGIAEGAALISVLLLWRLADRRPVRALGLSQDRRLRRWLKGAAIATLMMGFIVVVAFMLIDGATLSVNTNLSLAALGLLGGFVGYLLQGPAEEVLFRGYMLENIQRQWGVRPAIVVTALAFGVVHAPNPAFGVVPFVNLVLFGLAAALYKVYADGNQLWGVLAMHTVWNWLQQVVFGLPNSGIAPAADYTLFSVSPNTDLPALFWGGGFGPEGTFAATLVLLVLAATCLRRARRVSALSPTKSTRRVAMARSD